MYERRYRSRYAIKEMGIQPFLNAASGWWDVNSIVGPVSLRIILSKMGIDIMTHAEVDSCSASRMTAYEHSFEGWLPIASKVLLIAAGIKPNVELAKDAGLAVIEPWMIYNDGTVGMYVPITE